MNRRRIAFVLGSLGRGGAEKVISILSDDYARLGWETDIVLLLSSKKEYEINASTRIIDLSGNVQSRILRLPFWVTKIRRYVKNSKPDIVLSFAARINIISVLACRDIVNRLYLSERNDPKLDGRTKFIDFLTKRLYPRANGIIFQTKRVCSYFPYLQNSYIIPNPISIGALSSDEKSERIVSVGSLKTQKNHALLISAFRQISVKYSNCTLEIYGDGPLHEDLSRLIDSLNLRHRVILRGGVPNIHQCIADAQLFVLSSDYEGLSNALLEAMMMGLPCISTNCAGSDEYIEDGVNGILVPVGDETALANAMNRMLSDDGFRNKCGEQALKIASIVSKEVVLQLWHNLMD